MRLADDYTHDLLMAIHNGASIEDAMRAVTLAHAEELKRSSPAKVVAVDECPRCGGRVISGANVVRCVAGCGFRGEA